MIEQIIEAYPDAEFLKLDGHDDAIMGVEHNSLNLIYSVDTIIKTLMERDEMTEEDALEFAHFNILGAGMGEKTPIFCWVH
jgi:uncharacterized protein (UPF0276 family)